MSADARQVAGAAIVRLRRLDAADRLALGLLAAIPLAIGVPPSLAGRPLLAGDNLTQNYPLRILAGQIIRSGHLPLWDPFVWSGTPLLAGWNAGAMYPGTWLFAVMGGIAAWTVNYVAVGVVLATGTYVFFRRERLCPLAAFLGAAVFSFSGFMAAQMLHIGLVTGLSFLPWMLVAIDGMARREGGPGLGWVLLLGVAGALVVLAGDPRAISDAGLVVVIYLLARCWRDRRRAPVLLAGAAAAGALALGLSAVQWLPGVGFVASSQRGQTGYSFYANLSLGPAEMPLLLVPYFLGGYGDLGTHGYVGQWNLPEVTWSLGILPLVAVFALAGRRLRSPAGRPLGVWYALVVVGLLTALGSSTPLGHVFARIPVFGSERLQARNILLADVGIAALFAIWVDEVVAAGGVPALLAGRAARYRSIAPVAAALLLVAVGEAFPGPTASALGVAAAQVPDAIRSMTPYLVPEAVIVAGAGAFVLLGRRLERRGRRIALAAVTLVDLAFFTVNESIVPIPPSYIAKVNPLSAEVAAFAGPDGRYAIYNPTQESSDPGNVSLFQLGLSDLAILHGVPEVGGYGSVVDATYQQETATHYVETLRTSSLRSHVFDDLDLHELLTLPSYLATPLGGGAPPPATPPGPPQDGVPSDTPTNAALSPPVGRLPVAAGGTLAYMLPGPLDVASVTLVVTAGAVATGGEAGEAPPAGLRVGLAAAGGAVDWLGTAPAGGAGGRSTTLRVPAGGGSGATEVVVAAPGGSGEVADSAVVATRSGERLLLDGALQGSLEPPRWRYAGNVGPWLVFLDSATRGLAWVVPPGSTDPAAATIRGARVVDDEGGAVGPATTTVSTPVPALLVHSVAYAAGWQAEVRTAGRPAVTVPVERLGPLQAVRIPAGSSTIVWVYRPRAARVGALVSLVAAIAAAGLAASTPLRRRLRRRRGRREAAAARTVQLS